MLAPLHWKRFRALVAAAGWADPGNWNNSFRSWTRRSLGPYRVSYRVDSSGVHLCTGKSETLELPVLWPDDYHLAIMQSILLRSSLWLATEEAGEMQKQAEKNRREQAQRDLVESFPDVPYPFDLDLGVDREGVHVRLGVDGYFSPSQVEQMIAACQAIIAVPAPETGPRLTAHERVLADDEPV